MEVPIPQPQLQPQAQGAWFYFVLLLAVLIGFLYLLIYGLGVADVSANWAQNRCKPQVMPFASLYGYNTSENFNYCMNNMISDQAGSSLGPIYKILATFVGTISTLISTANSLRLSLATLVGGITKVFQEFSERFNTLMVRIRVSTVRIKMLFGRLFATFNAIIYMGMSGITAVSNLGDTFLFKFLDTFCFDPDTLIDIKTKGPTPIKDVVIGDVLSLTGGSVTATFKFYSDGQPMVQLGKDILVSTNHYVRLPAGGFTKADKHPDAVAAADWSGGTERPLICLNTSDHIIPVGEYRFLDYDETDAADKPTMIRVENILNNRKTAVTEPTCLEYSPGFDGSTKIALKNGGFVMAKYVTLGQEISKGRVVGIVQKNIEKFVRIGEDVISASALVWDEKTNSWIRAWHLGKIFKKKQAAYSFVVSPTATIETRQGTMIRDYMEIMSPDSEAEYTKEITLLF